MSTIKVDTVQSRGGGAVTLTNQQAAKAWADFDGALIPNFIGDCSGLQKLIKLMEGNGYNKDLIEKICYKNWIRILSRTFK